MHLTTETLLECFQLHPKVNCIGGNNVYDCHKRGKKRKLIIFISIVNVSAELIDNELLRYMLNLWDL
jgi:hypothetical protein